MVLRPRQDRHERLTHQGNDRLRRRDRLRGGRDREEGDQHGSEVFGYEDGLVHRCLHSCSSLLSVSLVRASRSS
jgi:hypothetical protein